ncbi:MAG: cupin domain-containing protein [Roseiflexaceae bacterium]
MAYERAKMTMLPEVEALIEHYQFEQLPIEGTLFRQMYRSASELDGHRPVGTAIIGLYCEEPHSVSLFHKLSSDEVWHFYAGDPFRLVLLYPDGSSTDVIMGNNPFYGQHVQYVVPAGVWQAAHLIDGGRYALYGCTMAPGFTDESFIGGTMADLLPHYPDRADDIAALACPDRQTHLPKGFSS